MHTVIDILIGLVALLHLYFLWLEMFAWTTRGPKVFRGFPKDLFEKTKAMAANQGLYNGFLSAGLIWSLFIHDADWFAYVALFFLLCVTIAGIYGAYSVSKRVFYVQGLPALVTMILLLLERYVV